jgi:DNA-directed RNA polymerase specialized sigma24 family protein
VSKRREVNDGRGVPQNLQRTWALSGHDPARGHYMRVRANKWGHYSSAHSSLGVEARRSELDQELLAAGLTARQREALVLAAEGVELPAIAEHLGLTYESAKSLMRDARRRLKERAEAKL